MVPYIVPMLPTRPTPSTSHGFALMSLKLQPFMCSARAAMPIIPIPRPVCMKVSLRYSRSNGGMPPSSRVSRLKIKLMPKRVAPKMPAPYSMRCRKSPCATGLYAACWYPRRNACWNLETLCDVDTVGFAGRKKCDCCFSGVLWNARIARVCGAFGDACRNVAVMAKGLRKRDAMMCVCLCDVVVDGEVEGGAMIYVTSRTGNDVLRGGKREKCQAALTPRHVHAICSSTRSCICHFTVMMKEPIRATCCMHFSELYFGMAHLTCKKALEAVVQTNGDGNTA